MATTPPGVIPNKPITDMNGPTPPTETSPVEIPVRPSTVEGRIQEQIDYHNTESARLTKALSELGTVESKMTTEQAYEAIDAVRKKFGGLF